MDTGSNSSTQAAQQAGQTYNTSVDLRQASEAAFQQQVASELMGRSILSRRDPVPRSFLPPDDSEDVDVETRLITLYPTQLNEEGDIVPYRPPKSSSFYSFKRQTEIYYHDLQKDLFVERRACTSSYEILMKHNIVVIISGCGDGRTTLGCWLLKTVAEELNCEGIRINSPKDWTCAMEFDSKKGEKLVVMLDDIFGGIGLADFMVDEWRPHSDIIWSYVHKKEIYLILTSKKNLYLQGIERMPFCDLFKQKFVLDMTLEENMPTWPEKKEMLRKHLHYRGLDEDIAANLPEDSPSVGFCLLINQFCHVDEFQKWGLRFFTKPVLWYARDLECLQSTERKSFGALVVILLNGGFLKKDEFSPYDDQDEYSEEKKKLLKYTVFRNNFSAIELMKTCEYIENVFIRYDKEEDGYRFVDKHMSDATMLVFGKYHHQEVIKKSSLDFLCEYVVTVRYDLDRPDKDIFLVYPKQCFELLSERFAKEIIAGNVERIVTHRAFLDDAFTEAFFKFANEKNEIVKILKAKDKKTNKGLIGICTEYGKEEMLKEIAKSGTLSKLSSKEWMNREKQEAVSLAERFKLTNVERILNRM